MPDMLNQKANNEEKVSHRIVVTVAGSTVHPVLGTIPNKGCLPIPIQGTGTITTVNADTSGGKMVTGTGTAFITGIEPIPQVGDYLASDAAGSTVRRIMRIDSDTRITLEAKFVTQLTAANLYIVRKSTYKMIYAKSTGTADAVLQEQPFIVAETFMNGGSPVSYDASAANNKISFQLDE